MQVASWCNVILRDFQFHKYPKHTATLKVYAFKPIIVLVSLTAVKESLILRRLVRVKTWTGGGGGGGVMVFGIWDLRG